MIGGIIGSIVKGIFSSILNKADELWTRFKAKKYEYKAKSLEGKIKSDEKIEEVEKKIEEAKPEDKPLETTDDWNNA